MFSYHCNLLRLPQISLVRLLQPTVHKLAYCHLCYMMSEMYKMWHNKLNEYPKTNRKHCSPHSLYMQIYNGDLNLSNKTIRLVIFLPQRYSLKSAPKKLHKFVKVMLQEIQYSFNIFTHNVATNSSQYMLRNSNQCVTNVATLCCHLSWRFL